MLQIGEKFSSYDVDHDGIEAVSCSASDGGKGGWWFMGTANYSSHSCYALGDNNYRVYANGNGLNKMGLMRYGIIWANDGDRAKPLYPFKGSEYRITKIEN